MIVTVVMMNIFFANQFLGFWKNKNIMPASIQLTKTCGSPNQAIIKVLHVVIVCAKGSPSHTVI